MTVYVINSGQTSDGIIVNSGDGMIVYAGGIASGAVVNSGGNVTVFASGYAFATIVNTGGTLNGFGTDTGSIVNAGGMENIAGGSQWSSAVAIGTVVNSGGVQSVTAYGVASATSIMAGGAVMIAAGGIASGTMIANGGSETVALAGMDSSTVVSSGGTETVLSGGAVYFATVMSGGTLVVASGGVAYNRIVDFVNSGQTISGFVVSNGVTLNVQAGGVANATIVEAGGVETVASGGSASGSIVNGDGSLAVASGGVAYTTTVNSGDTSNLGAFYAPLGPPTYGFISTTSGEIFTTPPYGLPGILDNITPFGPGLASGSETIWGSTVVSGTIGPAGTLTVASGAASGVVISGGVGVVLGGGSVADLYLYDTVVSKSYITNHMNGVYSGWFTGVLAGTLEVQSGGIVTSALITNGGTLTVDSGGTLTSATMLTGGIVNAASGAIVACFAVGTRIATETGDIPVEQLAVGTRVRSAFGGTVPVQWIGQRDTDCRHHPRPWDVWPVRVVQHAFGPKQPARDLLLSPDHALYVDGNLVPVRYLLNGASIRQEQTDRVHYFHLELPAHDVIFAEGLPAESYLDTGNRAAFSNGGAATMLHPDFAVQVWQSSACAPLLRAGAGLAHIRARQLARATKLGFHQTDDADMHLLVAGKRIDPVCHAGRATFAFSATEAPIILASRADVPAELHAAHQDHRRLGVAVAAVAVDGRDMALADCAGAGWHAPEPGFRWTDGAATLHLPNITCLVVTLGPAMCYWAASLEFAAGQARLCGIIGGSTTSDTAPMQASPSSGRMPASPR